MKKEEYISKVLSEIPASRKIKKRIKEDLDERISIAFEEDPFFDIVKDMGTPKECADEFNEHLYQDGNLNRKSPYTTKPYEYKSKKSVFGLPLLHINTGGNYGTATAKGIVAIGDVAIGVISIGGVSLGLFSFGGVAIGLAALGGVALGGIALGGVALGGIALGGVSVGLLKAFGAVSI